MKVYHFILSAKYLFEYTSEVIKLKVCTCGTENNGNTSVFKFRM